ncbi:hypothetical protein NC651_017100 [Populus alba x Populus x berolinensis]|nr:hypothetical protein NC651_017100 [Populus alba x Populus x berolinensis]
MLSILQRCFLPLQHRANKFSTANKHHDLISLPSFLSRANSHFLTFIPWSLPSLSSSSDSVRTHLAVHRLKIPSKAGTRRSFSQVANAIIIQPDGCMCTILLCFHL